jgi:sterol desaturase/sphingolipid hydroxylase (fatty acid hydroxylase superfamily)
LLNDFFQLIVNNPWSTANICVVVLLVVFEIIIPLKKYPLLSRSQREDIFWLVTNKFLSINVWSLLTYKFGDLASRALAGYNINLETQHVTLQLIAFFLLSDLISFFSHRLLHKNDYLWQFHQLHHSTEDLTTTSGFRHHWLEGLYYGVWHTALASVLIVNPNVRLAMTLLISFTCYFQHANLKIPLNGWVDLIFITPLNHRWHHSQVSYKPKGQNFGLILSIWDRWFGSHYVPPYEPEKLGTDSEYPKTLASRLIYPFIK